MSEQEFWTADTHVAFGRYTEPNADGDGGEEARQTSRETTDTARRWPVNNNSMRVSIGGRRRSPSDTGIVQAGLDGLDIVLAVDFDDAKLEAFSKWAQAAGDGAPDAYLESRDPAGFLETGLAHQSTEDIRFAFAVRGVSRAVTHMLVRTRQAAFKQQSQQGTWQGDMPEFRMPESCWADSSVREQMIGAMVQAHRAYNYAIKSDIPYKDARYILPEGTTTFIFCEYSLRTFIDMYAYRGCIMFQEELVFINREMRRLLVEAHPYLEPVIKISCEKIHRCTFQGPERVEETCPFPWATEADRLYRQPDSGYDR